MNNIIPHKWEVKKFDEIFDVVTDYVANGSFASLRENVSYKDDEDYAILVRLQDYSNKFQKNFVYVDEHAYNFLSKSKLNPNDLVICNVGAAGIIFKVPDLKKPMTLGPNSILVRTNESSDYMYYYIQSSIGQQKLKDITTTTAQPKFNKTDFKSIKCILPPLKEQQKIAEILSSVDAAIEKTEQVIAKTEEVKKGLMQQLLTKGIGHTEYKQTEIGEIPVDWKVQILGDISTITRLAGAEYTDYWNPIEDGNIIALRGYNIGRNKLILDNVEKISEDLSNKLYRSKLFIDDIVFPCVGTIGKAAVIYEDNKFHINQNIAKITPNPNIKSEYLVHYLMSDNIRSEILKYNTSTSQPNVLVGNLRKFKIIVPSVDEQQMIASILNNYDKKIDIEFKKLEVLKDLKRGLMQQLLTGQVRVKID